MRVITTSKKTTDANDPSRAAASAAGLGSLVGDRCLRYKGSFSISKCHRADPVTWTWRPRLASSLSRNPRIRTSGFSTRIPPLNKGATTILSFCRPKVRHAAGGDASPSCGHDWPSLLHSHLANNGLYPSLPWRYLHFCKDSESHRTDLYSHRGSSTVIGISSKKTEKGKLKFT